MDGFKVFIVFKVVDKAVFDKETTSATTLVKYTTLNILFLIKNTF